MRRTADRLRHGNSALKLWRWIAVLALAAAAPAFAQDAPTPAPMPMFHAPVATGDDVAPADQTAAPGDQGQTPLAPAADTAPTVDAAPPPATAAPAAPVVADPQPVTLAALVTDGGKTLEQGVIWRVFSAKPDGSGQLQLAAKSEDAVAKIKLVPGTYVVHVAYGHIVSYFGDVNAVVRADLQVQPGQLTDATLYHKAAQVSFKLVSEAGGSPIADVDWTVKAGDGSSIFTNTGAFPSTVLQEGDYTVFAKRGDKVYNRQFEVQAGQPKEIEVLTTVY